VRTGERRPLQYPVGVVGVRGNDFPRTVRGRDTSHTAYLYRYRSPHRGRVEGFPAARAGDADLPVAIIDIRDRCARAVAALGERTRGSNGQDQVVPLRALLTNVLQRAAAEKCTVAIRTERRLDAVTGHPVAPLVILPRVISRAETRCCDG